jgi:hypothetical protein
MYCLETGGHHPEQGAAAAGGDFGGEYAAIAARLPVHRSG